MSLADCFRMDLNLVRACNETPPPSAGAWSAPRCVMGSAGALPILLAIALANFSAHVTGARLLPSRATAALPLCARVYRASQHSFPSPSRDQDDPQANSSAIYSARADTAAWLGVLALGIVEQRQVVETVRHIGMLGAEGFFADLQRALIQRLGSGILALGFVEQRQVVEAGRDIGMLGADGFFVDRQGFFQQ